MGDDVLTVQKNLNVVRKINHGNWAQLTENSMYDSQTAEAVRQYQIAKNLSPTGVYDSHTDLKLWTEARDCGRINGMLQLQVSALNNQRNFNTAYIGPAPQLTSFTGVYSLPSQDTFADTYGGQFSSIWSDVFSIIDAVFNNRTSFNASVGLIKDCASTIVRKFKFICSLVSKNFRNITKIGIDTIKKLFGIMEKEAELSIKIHVAEVEKAAKMQEAGKAVSGKALGAVKWGPTIALVVYYIGSWLSADTEADKNKAAEGLKGAIDGLIGALISVLLEKVVTIIVTRVAVGAAAGSIVPGAGNAVGVIVGFVLAVLDIISVLLTGKSVGEWVWEGVKTIGGWMAVGASVGAKTFYEGLKATPQGCRSFNRGWI